MEPEDLAVIGHTGDLLVDIYARNLTHIYILPQCSTTAARVLNPAGMDAQFERLRCAISRGILSRLDILGIDTAGDLYVIELKKDSGYDDAYAQTREYIDWIEEDVAVKGQRVFGIICLNDPTKDLIEKVKADDQMRLFEYSISYSEII